MPHFRDLLIGRAQAQFLLMFHTLPEMKHRLQRKMKGHNFTHIKTTLMEQETMEQRMFTQKWARPN